MLRLWLVEKYDEEMFTSLFNVTNKIKVGKIFIRLYQSLSYKGVKNICAKVYNKIRSLETQDIISNEVS